MPPKWTMALVQELSAIIAPNRAMANSADIAICRCRSGVTAASSNPVTDSDSDNAQVYITTSTIVKMSRPRSRYVNARQGKIADR